MQQSLLSRKTDIVFRKIFGDANNTDILASFLQAVLDLPASEYERIEIDDPHLLPDIPGDKLGILDVKLHTRSGNVVDIELQLLNTPAFRKRIIFYTARMLAEQIKAGEDWRSIERAISIVITDFVLINENESYYNRYRLYDNKTGSEFTNAIEINVLELPKLSQKQDDSELWEWLRFLNSENEEELTMLAENNLAIKKAVGVLRELSADERTRMIAEREEKARRDELTRMRGAEEKGFDRGVGVGVERGRKEGREEGREEGLLEGKKQIAKNMIIAGLSTDAIIQMTGLSAKDIEELK